MTTLPAILRAAANLLEQPPPATPADLRDRIEVLQRVVTAASWLKAEWSRQLPGYLPLSGPAAPRGSVVDRAAAIADAAGGEFRG